MPSSPGEDHPMSAQERERLRYQPALDGLRCGAVAAVVLFHLGFNVVKGGNIGVDVFFVLSGYLITTLLIRERRSTGRVALGGFWRRRARRLLPSLLVVCALVTVLYLVDSDATAGRATIVGAGSALVYLSAWVAAFDWWSMGWMGHTWSLSVEEFFYALFPLALVVLARRLGHRWVYLATVAAIGFYLVAANVLHWSGSHLYAGPDMRAQQLLIGCSLAVALDGAIERVGVRVRTALAVLAAGFLVAWVLLVPWTSSSYLRWGETAVALAAAVVVWYLMTVPHGWLTNLLAAAPLVWVGRRSYTVYLVHYPLIGLLGGTGDGQGISVMATGRRVLVAALVIPTTLVYAGFSYRHLEGRFLSRRSAAAGT